MPDSEIIFSPSAIDFETEKFVQKAGGHLSTFKEYLATGWHTGGQVIKKVALDMSVNPRILLGLLEYQSHWVTGKPSNLAEWDYPMGHIELDRKDLFLQSMWATQALYTGYFGWREGRINEVKFADGKIMRLAPELNAGSVALIYFFAQMNSLDKVNSILYSSNSFPAFYNKMFGNAWQRAQSVEPLFPSNFRQPTLELPYLPGKPWSFTGGPHPAWGEGTLAAIDFAPPSSAPGCTTTHLFVTASAPGLVIRSGSGVVIIDLDGDGNEQTGWNLLYLHIATQDRIEVGKWVDVNQPIGHPSCEGGYSTGTHVHFARKYNGEWIAADGPLPFVLSGWRVHNGEKPYLGSMTKDKQIAVASTSSSVETLVTRPPLSP
jgi:murein DD-endopeptidase MepM/ murein hydrolase activator NlpD